MQERQDRIAQMQQAMSTQASDLFASWSPPALQQFVSSKEETEAEAQGTAGLVNGVAGSQGQLISTSQPVIIKSGTIMFAVLETSLNSDEPSPILATIVDGPFKGSRLVGQFQRVDKKVVLSFNTMNIPDQPQSIQVSAVAIDPDTARTALASNVDSHYFQRFGLLFASEFLSGLGEAIQQSGSVTSISTAGISVSTTSKTTGQEALMALGKVGDRAAEVLAPYFGAARRPSEWMRAWALAYCL